MAEVIGTVAACAQIIELIGKTSSFLKNRIHRSSSTKLELVTLLGRLTAYKGLIRGIQFEAECGEADQTRLSALVHVAGPLDVCIAAVKQISKRIETLSKCFVIGQIIDSGHKESVKVS
jgi:hypothetical protein